ncbi:hypothetical protein D9M72_600090 [compost metagenome]
MILYQQFITIRCGIGSLSRTGGRYKPELVANLFKQDFRFCHTIGCDQQAVIAKDRNIFRRTFFKEHSSQFRARPAIRHPHPFNIWQALFDALFTIAQNSQCYGRNTVDVDNNRRVENRMKTGFD